MRKPGETTGRATAGSPIAFNIQKNIESTDTNLTLASYRYSTSKFYDFDEANQQQNDNDSKDNHKRSKLQLSINQTIWEGTSLYVTAYQQKYWGESEQEKNLSFGLNTSLNGISYNVSYSYSKLQGEDDDQQIALNIRIPLSRWLPNSWATYNATHQKRAETRQQAGLTGTLLDDNRLSYSLQQSHADQGGSDSSSLNASYRSAYGTLNTGYYYDKDSQQTSYGLAGGIVAHSQGITLSQPLGDSFALIDTNGASGARVQNIPGVKTDWRGFAIVPYLTSYTENHIMLDTTTLPADVDVTQNSERVIPNKGAMVVAHFDAHVGVRALITLTRPGGKKVPFGAVAVSEDQTLENIVDDGGVLYLSGIKTDEPTVIHVKWGTSASQQCKATLNLQPAASQIQSVTALCL